MAAPAADLRLPHIFGSGMVLQQGKPAALAGLAELRDEIGAFEYGVFDGAETVTMRDLPKTKDATRRFMRLEVAR